MFVSTYSCFEYKTSIALTLNWCFVIFEVYSKGFNDIFFYKTNSDYYLFLFIKSYNVSNMDND